jgi:hypothetical protein
MMKSNALMWTAMAVTLLFAVLQVHAADVCPDTTSQGGNNSTSARFTLHGSVGGVGVVSQSSASFQADVGYIPQVLSGCNCVPCDDFITLACEALQLNQPTAQASALVVLQALLAGNDLTSVDICGDGNDGTGSPDACAAFILSYFQP